MARDEPTAGLRWALSRLMVLAALGLCATGCDASADWVPAGYTDVDVASVVLRPDGTVQLVPPVESGRVVAYVSRAEQRLYVERAFRDQAQNIFNAHISVSTGHWRIPLPGDSPSEPLTPGVPEREFEEFDLEDVDVSAIEPGRGDFRIISGGYAPLHLRPACVATQDGASYVQTAPLNVAVNDASKGQFVREDYTAMGSVQTYEDAACTTALAAAEAMMWVSPSGGS